MKILPEIQQIGHNLERPQKDFAFVLAGDTCYYSYFPQNMTAPSSAVVKLLQGLFEIYKDHSFFILRHRVWTSRLVNPMDHGMVKVVAKRISLIQKSNHNLKVSCQFIEIGRSEDPCIPLPAAEPLAAKQFANEKRIWEYLETEIQKIQRGPILHDYHRPIAAVCVDQNGFMLGKALNTSSVNKTRHAEINLIQDFYSRTGQKLPRGTQFYVSHKPCKMCAGMIIHWCEEVPAVHYQIEERGCFSRFTALDAPSSAKTSQPNLSNLDSPTP